MCATKHWSLCKNWWYTIGKFIYIDHTDIEAIIEFNFCSIFREYLGKQLEKENEGGAPSKPGQPGSAPIAGKA